MWYPRFMCWRGFGTTFDELTGSRELTEQTSCCVMTDTRTYICIWRHLSLHTYLKRGSVVITNKIGRIGIVFVLDARRGSPEEPPVEIVVHALRELDHIRVPRERSSSKSFWSWLPRIGRAIVPAGRSDQSGVRLNRAVEIHGRGEERAVGLAGRAARVGPRFARHAFTW